MSQKQMEKRTYQIDFLVEKRDAEPPVLTGHAAVFNIVGDGVWFREKVAPGAFRDSISKDDIRLLFNHDANYVLGRNKAGTLTLEEDDRGLFIKGVPPDTQFARDLLISVERGDITQMSFGFETLKDSWEKSEGNEPDLRTLEKVKLWDVSLVTYPFYKDTDVAVRSHEAWVRTFSSPEPLTARLLRRQHLIRTKNVWKKFQGG